MTYLLDTNLISELAKPAPSRAVSTWIRDHEDECALASVTVAELARGVCLKPLNSKRRLELEMSLAAIRVKYRGRILSFDEDAALRWGEYLAAQQDRGRLPGLHDSFIAATALAARLTVVTRNEADFPGVSTLNPF